MYSNDTTQIRSGLTNYLGAIISSLNKEPRAAKQDTIAILIEEALKLAQDENKVIDLYAVVPLFRGLMFVFNQRILELQKLPENKLSQDKIAEYRKIVKYFDELIALIK